MFESNVTIILAFMAGLTSFFAPCVTVLVPAFLSHMAGVSLTDLQIEALKTFEKREIEKEPCC